MRHVNLAQAFAKTVELFFDRLDTLDRVVEVGEEFDQRQRDRVCGVVTGESQGDRRGRDQRGLGHALELGQIAARRTGADRKEDMIDRDIRLVGDVADAVELEDLGGEAALLADRLIQPRPRQHP